MLTEDTAQTPGLTDLDNDAPVLVGLADALPDQRHDLTIALAAHARREEKHSQNVVHESTLREQVRSTGKPGLERSWPQKDKVTWRRSRRTSRTRRGRSRGEASWALPSSHCWWPP